MNKPLNSTINKPSNRLASRPAGITSLLFVLAISLVLIVMVGGIAALTVREQQQASNTELSNRALQTAEAGVKAAVAKLSATPTYSKDTCGTAFSNANDLGLSITDQTITCATVTSLFSTTYDGFLESDRTTQFIYAPSALADIPYYLKLSWNAPSLGDTAANIAAFGGSLYPIGDVSYTAAAMVEMNIIYWPKTTLAGCQTGITATGTCGFKNATLLFAPGNNTNNTKNPIANTCGAGTYSCTTTNDGTNGGFSIENAIKITMNIATFDPSKYNYAIRITPRYKSTHFAFTAYQTGGTTIAPAQSNKAQIDITAKVGNLYRRVKAEKIITPSAIETIGTSVLYAGLTRPTNQNLLPDICKTIFVNPIDYTLISGTPGPLCQ